MPAEVADAEGVRGIRDNAAALIQRSWRGFDVRKRGHGALLRGRRVGWTTEHKVAFIFCTFDLDGDGLISLHDAERMCTVAGVPGMSFVNRRDWEQLLHILQPGATQAPSAEHTVPGITLALLRRAERCCGSARR